MDSVLTVDKLFIGERAKNSLVRDVSFELGKGEILGLVGESGSGKTLTALSLIGLLPSSLRATGISRMRGEGEFVTDEVIKARRGKKIAMIFQNPMTAFSPYFRLEQHFVDAARLHRGLARKAALEEACDAMESVGLPTPALQLRKYPHQLSGGQLQRVAIALSLICKPEVLIADEPTTALDVTVQSQVAGLLIDLARQNDLAMIFITHDLSLVNAICDNVVVMQQGDVCEIGSKTSIFSQATHPYTKKLIGAVPSPRYLSRTGSVEQASEPAREIPSGGMRANSPEALVEMDMVCKIYGSGARAFSAVSDVCIEVVKGQTLALVGESGSGKSTVAQCLTGLTTPTSGRVIVDGENILDLRGQALRELRRRIGVVFQNPYSSLNPRMKVRALIAEAVELSRGLKGVSLRDAVEEHLLEVGLGGVFLDRYPHALSGGQRQRVAIARALALQPEILVLDEATSALDVSVQAQIMQLLLDIKHKKHLTYLFISHNLAVVEAIADNVVVMRGGKVVEQGAVDAVFQRPQTEYTQLLLNSVMSTDPDWRFERPTVTPRAFSAIKSVH